MEEITWCLSPRGEGWGPENRDVAVWVDLAKLDVSWRRDDGYVGVNGVGSNMPGRYDMVPEWLARFVREKRPVFMPMVGLNDEGDIAFSDGRHRVAWLRDHGAGVLPIAVPREEAAKIEARFGTQLRRTVVHLD